MRSITHRSRPSAEGWSTPLVETVTSSLLLDRRLDFWITQLDPVWSRTETRAQIVAIDDETADTKTFRLRPNGRWQGHLAGQFVLIEVAIEGARVKRCYSLSSAPGAEFPSITVKKQPGGLVSGWLHDTASVGDVITMGEAIGEFVLPGVPAHRPLFVAGGSGVTPILSILDDLAAQNRLGGAELVVYARSHADRIGWERLESLVNREDGLSLTYLLDDDPSSPHGFEAGHFGGLVPDFASRETWMCGPSGLMEAARTLYQTEDAAHRLHLEQFVVSEPKASAGRTGSVALTLTRSGRLVIGGQSETLLRQLEAAGARPVHGCRMGICKTCKCTKRSGIVENALTGERSGPGEEEIRICVSVPVGDVTLEL